MVAGLCRALLRDATEAEDAAQQVFLSAHRALVNGAEPREPAAWLAATARNECRSRISGRMREPLPTDTADDVAATDDPVAEAIRRADLAALWRAIRALPQQQREALLLREFGGLRYDELAAALAVTGPAVESLLFRARARLRTQLQAAYGAVTGASWLDSLARLLAGGGAPALATKAVAVGLGTAAVTGTAVVVPKVVDHDRRAPHVQAARHVQPARRAYAPAVTAAVVAAVAQAPLVAHRASAAPRVRVEHAADADDAVREPEPRVEAAQVEAAQGDPGQVVPGQVEQHDAAVRETTSGHGGRTETTTSHDATDGPGGSADQPLATTVAEVETTTVGGTSGGSDGHGGSSSGPDGSSSGSGGSSSGSGGSSSGPAPEG